MNLHKNARTCPRSRALMVRRVVEDNRPVSVVAEEFGVSPNTVYKWVRRYCEEGDRQFADRSSKPGHLAHRLDEQRVGLIIELRREYRMTALRISRQLGMSRSTVAQVLHRAGLSQLKTLPCREPVVRYEHDGPGELLHIDIKKLGRFWRAGHRATGNRTQDSDGAGWEYVHVCVDDYSRVAYVEVLEDERKETASGFLRRAVAWFEGLGITVKRVLTDNGSCYVSKLWRRTCEQLRICHKRTRPYRPQTNGKAERFIQTLLREWAYARLYQSSFERTRVLPLFVIHYNEHRAHGSLHHMPPISRLPGVHNVRGIHS